MRWQPAFLLLVLCLLLQPVPVAAQCSDCDEDGYPWPGDCNDGDPSVSPAAAEVCDAADNDCDGFMDNLACGMSCSTAVKVAGDQTLTSATGLSREPSVAWNGAGYGVAWSDGLGIYFARLDTAGALQGEILLITGTETSSDHVSLVWTGGGYGLAWDDARDVPRLSREIYFARITPAGDRQGREVRVTESACDAYFPSMVWSGSEFALAYEDCRDGDWEIYLTRLDAAGQRLGLDQRLTFTEGASLMPSLAWNGTGYAVAWHDISDLPGNGGNFEILFGRLDAQGARLGGDIRVSTATGSGLRPSLAWSGTGYGLAWYDRRNDPQLIRGEVFFAAMDAAGNKLAPEAAINALPVLGEQPSLAWNGNEYGLAWSQLDATTVPGWEVYLTRLDNAGGRVGPDLRVTEADGNSWQPALVWNGSTYGVAWDDDRDGGREIYFATVACPGDSDGDGYSVTDDCNDTDPRVNPGSVDLPGNPTDEDCDGRVTCNPHDAWRNRGQFVSCVARACHELVRQGLGDLDGRDCADLVRRAARRQLVPPQRRHPVAAGSGRPLAPRRMLPPRATPAPR